MNICNKQKSDHGIAMAEGRQKNHKLFCQTAVLIPIIPT